MIVRWPDIPNTTNLTLPRPAVYLLGTYIQEGAYQWQESVAAGLESRAGVVLYGAHPGPGAFREFVRWTLYWLTECDVVAIWMEPSTEAVQRDTEFELGYCLGRARLDGGATPIVGVHPGLVGARRSIEAVLEALGMPTLIYDDLDELVHAVGETCRGLRR